MIVLLNCSINLYANNDEHSSTGVLSNQDSTLISYDDLRIVNSKLIELNYQKEINEHLKSVVVNDSIIIADYQKLNNEISKDCVKLRRERNAGIIVSIIAILTSIVLLLK